MPYNLTGEDLAKLTHEQLLDLSDANVKMSRKLDGEMVRRGLVTPEQTPFQADRERAERTGQWPPSWGPFHRHFGNDAVHRDGGPECDQPGTPRRVFVFDEDALDEHERSVARYAVEHPGWQTGWPPEHGYYLGAWRQPTVPAQWRVSELWFNPDSTGSGWWATRGYLDGRPGAVAMPVPVEAWMPMPAYQEDR